MAKKKESYKFNQDSLEDAIGYIIHAYNKKDAYGIRTQHILSELLVIYSMIKDKGIINKKLNAVFLDKQKFLWNGANKVKFSETTAQTVWIGKLSVIRDVLKESKAPQVAIDASIRSIALTKVLDVSYKKWD